MQSQIVGLVEMFDRNPPNIWTLISMRNEQRELKNQECPLSKIQGMLSVLGQTQTGLCIQMTAKFSAHIACSNILALTAPQGKTDYHENNWERGRVSAAFNRAVSIFILINNAQQSAYLDLTDDIDLFGQIVSGVWDEERERNWENENELRVRERWRETALKAKQSIMLILLICFAYCYENNKQT